MDLDEELEKKNPLFEKMKNKVVHWKLLKNFFSLRGYLRKIKKKIQRILSLYHQKTPTRKIIKT